MIVVILDKAFDFLLGFFKTTIEIVFKVHFTNDLYSNQVVAFSMFLFRTHWF